MIFSKDKRSIEKKGEKERREGGKREPSITWDFGGGGGFVEGGGVVLRWWRQGEGGGAGGGGGIVEEGRYCREGREGFSRWGRGDLSRG